MAFSMINGTFEGKQSEEYSSNARHYGGHISNFGYNLIELVSEGGQKSYISFFPPANETTTPPYQTPVVLNHDENVESYVRTSILPSVASMCQFWLSPEEKQAGIKYKGGIWGSNNFPPLNTNWIEGKSLSTKCVIVGSKEGLIPFSRPGGRPFTFEEEIIPGSESWCTSINFQCEGYLLGGYLTNNPPPQRAIDCIVGVKGVDGSVMIRCAKRGPPSPNVDIPNKIVPGAGETIEPSAGGFHVKEQLKKAIREELALNGDFDDTQVTHIGTFEGNRDPRYSTFFLIEHGICKKFGMDRGSKTDVYYIEFDSKLGQTPSTYVDDFDKVEIAGNFWISLEKLVEIPVEKFMIPEHALYAKMIRENYLNGPTEYFVKESDEITPAVVDEIVSDVSQLLSVALTEELSINDDSQTQLPQLSHSPHVNHITHPLPVDMSSSSIVTSEPHHLHQMPHFATTSVEASQSLPQVHSFSQSPSKLNVPPLIGSVLTQSPQSPSKLSQPQFIPQLPQLPQPPSNSDMPQLPQLPSFSQSPSSSTGIDGVVDTSNMFPNMQTMPTMQTSSVSDY